MDDAIAVWVEFTGVELKVAGSQATSIDFSSPKKINLLDLQGSASEPLISDQSVEAGDYEWVRLKVNAQSGVLDSYIELATGSESLVVPSGNQTGLKLNNPFTITAGGVSNFTIDFNLRKSVTNPIGLSDYFLKPSLRIIDNSQVGQISGTVDPTLFDQTHCSTGVDRSTGAGGAVYLYNGFSATTEDYGDPDNPPLTSALIGLNTGTGFLEYEIGFVEMGDYTVTFTCQSLDDDSETDDNVTIELAANVTVQEGATTTANFSTPAP